MDLYKQKTCLKYVMLKRRAQTISYDVKIIILIENTFIYVVNFHIVVLVFVILLEASSMSLE